MRVLMVDHFLPGNIYTKELVDELKHFVDLTLLYCSNAELIDGVNCKPELYGKERSKIKAAIQYLHALKVTRKEVKNGNYDIVHIQDFKKQEIEMPIIIGNKKNYGALVHTVHNILPHEYSNEDMEQYRKLYNACDALIVHNTSTQKRFIELFPEIEIEKIKVIPHGSYHVQPQKYEYGAQKNFLIFGRVRPYKGVDVFIRAIAKLDKEIRDNCKFIIAGNQDSRVDAIDYEKLAKDLGVENCVRRIRRRIEEKELDELFSEAYFCVFPYKEIYGSGALLMAYSYGKPVIASNVPTFIEETEMGKCGYLFENGNENSLAERIKDAYYCSKSDYSTFVKTIDHLVNTKYNWSNSARMTYDVYKSIKKIVR